MPMIKLVLAVLCETKEIENRAESNRFPLKYQECGQETCFDCFFKLNQNVHSLYFVFGYITRFRNTLKKSFQLLCISTSEQQHIPASHQSSIQSRSGPLTSRFGNKVREKGEVTIFI